MKSSIQTLYDMRKLAIKMNQPQPYLFQQYNVTGFYPTTIGIKNMVNRFLYAFVDALNEHYRLPKLMIIMPDKDLLMDQENKAGISVITGVLLHYIIKQIDHYIEHQKNDLLEKKPGAWIENEYPKIIWMRDDQEA